MLSADANSYFRIATLMVALLWGQGVQAQIVSDDTANTQVQTDKGISQITGGIQSGTNLFHSFAEFSVITDNVANFDNPLEIERIFSRVTGGISEIDGLIQTQGNADLFLLNPAGIIFGANAQLDIGGSFVVSTGDRLIFADDTEFRAIDPETEPILTVSAPVGLQYGGDGEIVVLPSNNRADPTSGLSIYPGNTLALLGGNISIGQNSLNTVGSNTEIASVKSGTIGLATDELGWQFDYSDSLDFGEIDFDNGASIRSNGRTYLRGKTINFSANSGILNFSQANETNSQINLTATESIAIDRGLLITQVGQRSGLIDEAITNTGGDIVLTAPQIDVSNGSFISAGTLSDGDGGNIRIDAKHLRLFSQEGENPAIITTSTGGGGIGRGGSISLNIDTLQIENGSQIQALAGIGAGGTITVNAKDKIQLSGTGILRSQDIDKNISETELASGFSASSGNENLSIEERNQFTGASGSLIINTPKLIIDDSAQISVGSYGLAEAGNIEIYTDRLNLDTAGQIIANTASNEGGSINVWAETIILDRHSSISTTADSEGNGGNISLVTENLALLDANQISADAKVGNGGNIYIDTQGLFVDPSSSITASSEIEQNEGTVEIFTLDLDSRLSTNYIESSSLVAEDEIASSCGIGIGLHSDRLRDVGRGGIPNNPFRETADIEVIGDLNIDWDRVDISNLTEKSPVNVSTIQPIVEASGWRVDSRGNIELVANVPKLPAISCSLDS